MKSLIALWSILAHECARRCCTSATRDIKTVSGRSEHEGESFLTITMPEFGKGFERSLDQGQVDPNWFPGFKFSRTDDPVNLTGLPLFLGGFLGRVFDQNSGTLLDEPDIEAIISIRQLTLMFGKINLPCSDRRVKAAIDGYVKTDQEVREFDGQWNDTMVSDFRRVSLLLFRDIFNEVDREVYHGRMIPKHGPGATADKLRGNAKFKQGVWTDRLEKYFPFGEYVLPNWRYIDQMDGARFLDPGSEIPARVVTVPKTLKTPRIIAMEPTAVQYAQQAVLAEILGAVRRNTTVRQFIDTLDQNPNRVMAHRGSLNGDLATLDLSEASDRVSNRHVELMLEDFPHLGEAVQACRSSKADVSGYGVIPLSKFASMGSALCFPFEAMAFLVMIFIGIERELNVPLSQGTIKSFRGKVRVYGDDIIVPVDYVESVVRSLETFGSKVNRHKSFWTGKFRESCGKEYYGGTDVSIVRVRRVFPTRRSDVQEVTSIVSLRNQLYRAGYWDATRWLDDRIRKMLTHFPNVLPTSPVLGRNSFLGARSEKACKHTHTPLVKGWVERSRAPEDPLSGSPALTKFLIGAERRVRDRANVSPGMEMNGTSLDHLSPVLNADHLERTGRPEAVNIKLGWFTPY